MRLNILFICGVFLSFSNEAISYHIDSMADGGCRPVMPSTISIGTILIRTAEYNYVSSESVKNFYQGYRTLE